MSEYPRHINKTEEDVLTEKVASHGPWEALRVFLLPELTGLERIKVHDATKHALWSHVDDGIEREIDDHLLIIEYMDRAIAAEILADLARARRTGVTPLPTEPVPTISVDSSAELV